MLNATVATPSDTRSEPRTARRAASRSGNPQTRASASGGGAAADLGTTGNRSAAVFGHQADRERRHRLRGKVRKHARRDLVRSSKWVHNFVTGTWAEVEKMVPRDDRFLGCGQRPATGNIVSLRGVGPAGKAGYGNLQACGSVWACPCCSPKIMKQRSDDLAKVLAWARREGHTIAMITLTMRHRRPDKLVPLWDMLSGSWAKVTSGEGRWTSETEESFLERLGRWEFQRQEAIAGRGRYPRGGRAGIPPVRRVGDLERYGVLGFARAVEVTNGSHGWHPHVHAVVILENTVSGAEGQFLGFRAAHKLGRSMFDRWASAFPVENRPDRDSGGLDVSVDMAAEKKLAEYLTKDGLEESAEHVKASVEKAGRDTAREVTHGMTKTGRKKGRTPFQVLADLDYDTQTKKHADRDLAIWLEWVDGSAGRRQITWSVGLRELAGMIEDEATDEELAEEEEGGDVVLTLPPATWKAVRRESWVLLDLLERDGLIGVTDYLDAYVIDAGTGECGLEYGHPSYERMAEWADETPPLWGDEAAA